MFPSACYQSATHCLAQLRARGWTLATAESCTGGLLGALVTEIPGSSAVFTHGYITYANAAKIAMLGVDTALFAAHGAVSEAVARAMAEAGIRPSNKHRKVGDYQLGALLSEGASYQDWEGTHTAMDAVRRRVRIYTLGATASPAARAALQRHVQATPALDRLNRSILFIEQPIARKTALDTDVHALAAIKPVIVDESDGELDAYVAAHDDEAREFTAGAFCTLPSKSSVTSGVLERSRTIIPYAKKTPGPLAPMKSSARSRISE